MKQPYQMICKAAQSIACEKVKLQRGMYDRILFIKRDMDTCLEGIRTVVITVYISELFQSFIINDFHNQKQ